MTGRLSYRSSSLASKVFVGYHGGLLDCNAETCMNKFALWVSMAFWLVMMGLLFKMDVLPKYTIEDEPGYEAVIAGINAPILRSMRVFKGREEVGTSDTVISPEPDGTYSIANVTTLKVKVGFIESRASAVLNISLDEDKQLKQLFLDVDFGGAQRAELVGVREGDQLKLEFTLGGEIYTETIPYDNAIISSYFNTFPLGSRLKVGQSWRTKFLDPLSQKARAVDVKVVGREPIELTLRKGRPPVMFNAFKIVTDWDGMELNAWASEDGVVLKEETPLGYTLVYRGDRDDQP